MSVDKQSGFTLIELMVAVGILGVLLAISIPMYRTHVQKSHRANAKAALMQQVQRLEKNFTQEGTYEVAGENIGSALQTTPGGTYTLSLAARTAETFTLQAVPAAGQAGDACGTMTVDQAGRKTPTVPNNCW